MLKEEIIKDCTFLHVFIYKNFKFSVLAFALTKKMYDTFL